MAADGALEEHFDLPPRSLTAEHPGGNDAGIVKHEKVARAKQARQGRHLAVLERCSASREV